MNNHFFNGFVDELTKHAGILDWLFGKKKQPAKAEEIKPGEKIEPGKFKSKTFKLPSMKTPLMGAGSRKRRAALKQEGVFGM